MKAAQEPQARTRMLARVLGPFFVVLAATAAVRTSDMQPMISEFAANPLWPWVLGAFNLLGGLIVVALHQYWRSAAEIIVSVLGWLLAVRGFFVLAFPETAVSVAGNAIGSATLTLSRTGFAVLVLVGLYLSYVGWAPAASRPTKQATSSRPDVPRAA